MKRGTKVWIGIAILAAGGIAALAIYNEDTYDNHPKSFEDDMHSAVAHGADKYASPKDISDDYRSNPISADRLYKRHVVRMNVVVREIGQDKDGVPFVALRGNHTDKDGDGVVCAWDGSSDVAGMRSGDEIVVDGYGAGQTNGVPVFLMCKLVQRGWPRAANAGSAQSATIDPAAWEWSKGLNPALHKAGVEYKLTTITASHYWIESRQCEKARAAIHALGKLPAGYVVSCTLPNDLPSKALWRESNP